MELHGKIAVVTGAASGLGLATCKVLAAAGVRIAGFDRDEKKLQALKSNLGDACLARVVDVAEESSVKDGIAAVVAAFGGVHVAVNCAVPDRDVEQGDRDQPDRYLQCHQIRCARDDQEHP